MFEGDDAVCLAGLRSDPLKEVEVKTCYAIRGGPAKFAEQKERGFPIEVSESAHLRGIDSPLHDAGQTAGVQR